MARLIRKLFPAFPVQIAVKDTPQHGRFSFPGLLSLVIKLLEIKKGRDKEIGNKNPVITVKK